MFKLKYLHIVFTFQVSASVLLVIGPIVNFHLVRILGSPTPRSFYLSHNLFSLQPGLETVQHCRPESPSSLSLPSQSYCRACRAGSSSCLDSTRRSSPRCRPYPRWRSPQTAPLPSQPW